MRLHLHILQVSHTYIYVFLWFYYSYFRGLRVSLVMSLFLHGSYIILFITCNSRQRFFFLIISSFGIYIFSLFFFCFIFIHDFFSSFVIQSFCLIYLIFLVLYVCMTFTIFYFSHTHSFEGRWKKKNLTHVCVCISRI